MTEDKTVKGILYGVPVTATIKGKPEYTPTTEDIKYAYAHWKGQEPEFDRWLAEVKAANWSELRGHLVDDFDNHPGTFWAEDEDGKLVEVLPVSKVIELIKGEEQ